MAVGHAQEMDDDDVRAAYDKFVERASREAKRNAAVTHGVAALKPAAPLAEAPAVPVLLKTIEWKVGRGLTRAEATSYVPLGAR